MTLKDEQVKELVNKTREQQSQASYGATFVNTLKGMYYLSPICYWLQNEKYLLAKKILNNI